MIRAVLLDLSGTLHIGEKPIPGAVSAVRLLAKTHSIPVLCLTNTTKVSRHVLHQQLTRMGFDCLTIDSILTSMIAARNYLRASETNLRPYCLLESMEDLPDSSCEPPYNCVLVGLAPSKFDYDHLNQAFQVMQHSDCATPLIAIHRALYYRDDTEKLSLGPGAFVTALEQAANTTAVLIGKPNPAFFAAALQQLKVPPQDVCMVGDDVVGDIQGAQQAGIGHTVLVQTGKYRAGDEHKLDLSAQPTVVVPSIVEAVDYILQQNQQQD